MSKIDDKENEGRYPQKVSATVSDYKAAVREFYANLVRDCIQKWDGQSTINLTGAIYVATGEVSELAIERLKSSEDCIRVRIAVAVDRNGYAVVRSVSGPTKSDEQAMREAYDVAAVDPPVIAQAFVEADIPRLPTVEGRTTEIDQCRPN